MNASAANEKVPFGIDIMTRVQPEAIGNLVCVMDVESTKVDDVNVPPPATSIPVMPPSLFPPAAPSENPTVPSEEIPPQEGPDESLLAAA